MEDGAGVLGPAMRHLKAGGSPLNRRLQGPHVRGALQHRAPCRRHALKGGGEPSELGPSGLTWQAMASGTAHATKCDAGGPHQPNHDVKGTSA